MRKLRVWALAAVIALAPAMTSCWPFKRTKPAPPPPAPVPTQPQPAEPAPVPGEQPPPEEGKPEATEPAQRPEDTGVVTLPAPSQKRPSPTGPPVETPPAAEPAPAPAPSPQLKQILTPQQEQQLNRIVDERIGRARQVLASLDGRRLNQTQTGAMNQIRTFIQQAEDARKSDLVRARNLAERADVLARDLMNSMR